MTTEGRSERRGRVWSVSVILVALLWTGALADELKPDELADKLHQECTEQWGAHGPIATCMSEKEEAFRKGT